MAFLLLLRSAVTAPGIGYALEFARHSEASAPKSRVGTLGGLETGWTMSAWLKYYDLSTSLPITEANIASATDNNLFNGFGGPGSDSFSFGSTHNYKDFLPTSEDFLEWHHYAISMDPNKTKTMAQWVDGVKVLETDISGYVERDWASDAALNFGMTCSRTHTRTHTRTTIHPASTQVCFRASPHTPTHILQMLSRARGHGSPVLPQPLLPRADGRLRPLHRRAHRG